MPAGGARYHVTDPFRVLGVGHNCTEAEAKQAYLRLVKQLHPDVSDSPNAEEQFRRVADAYDAVLTRIKTQSAGRVGGLGHAGYDAERMAARVKEFRERAAGE
jgi:curved DNA-binding protein CbpA